MTVEEQEEIIREKFTDGDVLVQKYRRLTQHAEGSNQADKPKMSKSGTTL